MPTCRSTRIGSRRAPTIAPATRTSTICTHKMTGTCMTPEIDDDIDDAPLATEPEDKDLRPLADRDLGEDSPGEADLVDDDDLVDDEPGEDGPGEDGPGEDDLVDDDDLADDNGDDDADDLVDDDADEPVVVLAPPAALASDDDDDDDDEEPEDDDVEASLDVILKERLVVRQDDDEDAPDTEDRSEGATKVLPKQPDEFVCQSCFLVKHPSQLADPVRGLCRDCV
ncbi:MAG: DUF4193 family protein [Acidimicrobiales bacterium]